MRTGGRVVIVNSREKETSELRNYSLDKERSYPVVKANTLVQKARHQLTAKELKLVDFMVSKVRENDTGFKPIETTIAEINEVMSFGRGSKNTDETIKALLALSNKGFWLKIPNAITISRWLQTAKIDENGKASLQLDPQLTPYLLKLVESKTGHARFSLADVVVLKSKYSIMLYELLMSWRGSMGVNGKPDEFLEYFGKSDMKWWIFNGKILTPAINEINSKTGIKVHYATRKQGGRTVEVELDFKGEFSQEQWDQMK